MEGYTIKFSCDILVNEPSMPLTFKILLNDDEIYNIETSESEYHFNINLQHTVGDVAPHSIKFVMEGKTDDHTVIDDNGKVVKSAQIEIENISFDDINITPFVMAYDNLISYTHNENGYSEEKTVPFDPSMGCNGVAELKFKFPIYKWLLEQTP
jgi:hypothetical protein